MDFLGYDFMQRALLAGALVGVASPAIGVFIVQRGLSLMGDGIGHVAFMGVAAGLMLGVSPVITALIFAVLGAVTIELLRQRGATSGDVALALVFYAGIAGGVLLIGIGDTSTLELHRYLFGSVLTVGETELLLVAIVATVTVTTCVVLRRRLFAIAYDEEAARVSGLPVVTMNLLVAFLAAVTVAVTAQVVGVLLVSALLVMPVATVQQVAGSFRATFVWSIVVGLMVTVGGLVIAYYTDVSPAATIVLSSLGLFVIALGYRRIRLERGAA